MADVLRLAERLWNGDLSTLNKNPFTELAGMEALEPGLAFVSSFANVTAIDTDEGLVLIDTGSPMFAQSIHAELRTWSKRPAHTAVFTHGHVDHVFGVEPFEVEARDNGWATPQVVAHDAVAARFDRYRLTAGYNTAINRRQFRALELEWPTEYRYPDRTYAEALTLEVGGETFELHHDRGETDDHTWVWIPARKVLCTGDLFIWASPNCGNPQKAQRYPREWAAALRRMAKLDAETLLPGHGPPIIGADRVARALDESAELLETLVEQTLALMNQGARLDDVLCTVKAPDRLLERPYLRPIYDEPAFIVHNIWRLYGGWYDGNPAHLKPAPDAVLARELAALAGGPHALADRAEKLSDTGDHALACHLVELASQACTDEGVIAVRKKIYARRSGIETSLMARNIFDAAAHDPAK